MAERSPVPPKEDAWRQELLRSRAGRRDGLPTVLRRCPERQPSLADEADFHRVLLHRYDIDDAPDDVQDCLFDLRWRGKTLFDKLFDREQPDVPFMSDRIVFDFVDRSGFSAYVQPSTALPGVYHVGMNVGLVARLYRSAYALMSLRDVFPQFGHSSEESASDAEVAACMFEPAGRSLRLFARGDDPLPSAAFADIRPKDTDRHFLAHIMVGVGLQWFYYHEFHHVWAGHLRLVQARKPSLGGPTGFAESDDEMAEAFGSADAAVAAADPEERRLRRLIEYDADKRAARRMFDALLNGQVMLNAVELNEAEKLHLMGSWALMLGTLFLLLNPCPGEDVRAFTREYPHPEVRFWGAFGAFADLLSPEQVTPYHDAIRAAHQVLKRLCRGAGLGNDSYSNSRARVEEVIDETNRLSAAVNQELYPLLFPYDTDQLLAARANPYTARRDGGAGP